MVKYAEIDGNYLGTFDSVANEFNRDFEINLNSIVDIIYTELSSVNITLDADPAETINFGGIVNAKLIVVYSDKPTTVVVDVVSTLPCDPILILSNQLAPSALASLTIQRNAGILTNAKIRIYG